MANQLFYHITFSWSTKTRDSRPTVGEAVLYAESEQQAIDWVKDLTPHFEVVSCEKVVPKLPMKVYYSMVKCPNGLCGIEFEESKKCT